MTLEEALEKHIIRAPYEGYDVDIAGLEETCKTYMMGLVTYIFNNFEKTDKTYVRNGKTYNRFEIVQEYLTSCV